MARDRKPARHRHRHLCDRGRFPRSGQMFAALAVPNFPLYLAGQAVSLTGTWMAPGPGRPPITPAPEPSPPPACSARRGRACTQGLRHAAVAECRQGMSS